MHSRIFQISERPILEEDYISEDIILERHDFIGRIADYVDEETDREGDLLWYLDMKEACKKLITFNEEEQSIIFHKGFKKAYFEPRLNQLKSEIASLTLEEFSNISDLLSVYKLNDLIEKEYGFYMYIDGSLMTHDLFVRYLTEGKKYYFGQTLDYHF